MSTSDLLIQSYVLCFDISSVLGFLIIAGAHFAHHKPYREANKFPMFGYDSDLDFKFLVTCGESSVIIICCCLFILV